jgi:hypothetical protein
MHWKTYWQFQNKTSQYEISLQPTISSRYASHVPECVAVTIKPRPATWLRQAEESCLIRKTFERLLNRFNRLTRM